MRASLFILAISVLSVITLCRCASTPEAPSEPAWVHMPTRTVDSGYIVFIGTSESPSLDKAHWKAEDEALQDLANECSFAPKGTRIEDRYDVPVETAWAMRRSYAKVAVPFEQCEAAKAAITPDAIRALANAAYAARIKEYQELVGDAPPAGFDPSAPIEVASLPPPSDSAAPAPLFVTRQQICYVKSAIILSPPNTYPEARIRTVLLPALQTVRTYEHAHQGGLQGPRAWSQVPRGDRVVPAAVAPRPASVSPFNPGYRRGVVTPSAPTRSGRSYRGWRGGGRHSHRRR